MVLRQLLPAPGERLGFHQLALVVRQEVGHRLAKVPGPCVGLKPTVQFHLPEPVPGDLAAEAADAVHKLINQFTVALVEPLGLSEEAVDNRHCLLDPFGVNDQAARLSDSVKQTAELMANLLDDICDDGPVLSSELTRPIGISKAQIQRCISKLSPHLHDEQLYQVVEMFQAHGLL